MATGDLSRLEGEPSPPGDSTAFDAWTALGMLVQLVVTPARQLGPARELLEAEIGRAHV